MNLPPNHRLLLRMALRLEQEYERLRQPPPTDHRVSVLRWEQVNRDQQRLMLAVKHRYYAAARECRYLLASSMQQLAMDLRTAAEELTAPERHAEVPKLHLLYEELASLETDFEKVQFDREAGEITVQSERIVLEGIDLGPFEIRLTINNLTGYRPYTVIALDPCHPASNDSVTHPHVQDDVLCEGEGHPAIARALADGRIGEFFVLVAQILRTYNSESPFQSLASWHGAPCADCDILVDDDDRSECDRCGCCLCGECVRCCPACDCVVCSECSTYCEVCGGRPCDQCVSQCADCGISLCEDCRNGDLCSTCYEKTLETNDAELETSSTDSPTSTATTPETATPEADDPVHPVCLGQTPVSP